MFQTNGFNQQACQRECYRSERAAQLHGPETFTSKANMSDARFAAKYPKHMSARGLQTGIEGTGPLKSAL